MISVPRLNHVFQTLTGGRQQPSSQYEPTITKHNMVVSARSSTGRPNLRSNHDHDHDRRISSSTSPLNATEIYNDTTKSRPQHDDASLSRAKRNRIASVSDHESLQKRRRLSRSSELPQVHIPLRGRPVVPQSLPVTQDTTRNNAAFNTNAILPQAPPLVTQDSSISNSPLNSPAYKPQYDQFKRIEEKAQKVVKKNSRNDAPKDDKRKLRSEHGSTRVKTELAQYFPAFDDMLSLVPADPNILTSKTPVVLVDDTPGFQPPPPQPDYFRDLQAPHNSEIIDLEQYAVPVNSNEDPLADSLYQKAHQKAERHEKQMKNGDKERAQHEKYQLERLVDELRGPDWLKTLGISGITDTEKRRYEVKRALFIRETKALIDKFKRWKEEEKRRKLEKQQHQQEEIGAEADEDYDEDHASSSTLRKRPRKAGANSRNRSRANSRPASASVSAEGIDSSEIDALASQQLLEEAKLASLQRRKTLNQASPRSAFFLPPEVFTKPFTTFFEKRHIRDAAVSGRNRGRKTYAFGQEMPELEEGEFELPDSILTEDAIKTSQRTRRRRMRSIDE